jgi:hypothetical protein
MDRDGRGQFTRGPRLGDVKNLRMTVNSAEELADDLRQWGDRLDGLTGAQVQSVTKLPRNRARRLHNWFVRHGIAEPQATPAGVQPRPSTSPVEPVKDPNEGLHILVVGDAHAAPEQNLRRFRWLARQVADLKPDAVIQMGDWYSLDSLCRHSMLVDRSQERLRDDLEAGGEAVDIFEEELTKEAGVWRPARTMTLGNHDDRASALANDQPWLEGILNIGEAHEARGWTVVPFLEPYRFAGCRFQHYVTAEGGRAPLAGKYHSRRVLERTKFETTFVGHSHRLDIRVESDHRGRRAWGVVAGCFLEHDEPYAREDNREWFRGNLELHNVKDGDFDLTVWSMDRIQRRYGD